VVRRQLVENRKRSALQSLALSLLELALVALSGPGGPCEHEIGKPEFTPESSTLTSGTDVAAREPSALINAGQTTGTQ